MANKTIFSNDAEIAVLSIVLNNPEMAHELDGLRYFMFQSTPHQALFLEIENMIEKQIPTEPALIIAQLEANNTISKVGGKNYIQQLVTSVYNKDTLSEYRKLIIQFYKTRSLVSLGAEYSDLAKVNVDTVDEKIGKLKLSLDTLMEVRGGLQTVHIGDVVKEVYDEILSGIANPGVRGSSWGVKELDIASGGKVPGELWVIGGRPGSGKTALLLNSIMADANNGVPSLLFEREMSLPQVTERLISLKTGIPITNIRLRILTKPQVEHIYEALTEIKKLPIYIDTSYRSSDLYYIESTVKKFKNLYGIQNVYADYLQIMIDRDDNQTHELGRLSRLFKALSNELGLCSILVSQLSRGVEMREDKRPVMSDLRQSGNLEEDADVVVGLYRDGYYNKESRFKNLMEFIILKYRNGPVGSITIKFDEPTNRIEGV